MRVIGGRYRGTPIVAPKGSRTRPTSDRVREAVFNILTHGAPALDLEGLRVLDLFAGSGAMGLEALSRGAAFGLFVDNDYAARAAIRRNIEALSLAGVTKILRRDALNLGEAGRLGVFDVVFADPPYGEALGLEALVRAAKGGWLAPDCVALVEERADVLVEPPDGFEELDRRRFGDTLVVILRHCGSGSGD